MHGKFITLEGIEGCGKSTQAKLLEDRLTREGFDVKLTREPGGTTVGDAIRGILGGENEICDICAETELLLFAASRAQLVRQIVGPYLAQGKIVISDRFMDSTTSYQACARGLAIESVLDINSFAIGSVRPDLTVLIDIDVATGFSRVASRNKTVGTASDRIEREDSVFHEHVREGYLEIASREPERIRMVDGSGDVDSVAEDIWRVVSDVLG
jgi:dTMP kinase